MGQGCPRAILRDAPPTALNTPPTVLFSVIVRYSLSEIFAESPYFIRVLPLNLDVLLYEFLYFKRFLQK